jgi:hypothetical protein
MNELRRRTPTAFDLAQMIVEQMDTIYWQTLWEKPDFVLAMFHRISQERHLSANNEAFDLLIGDGENAIKANDVDELRGIVLSLWDNQIDTAKTIGDRESPRVGAKGITVHEFRPSPIGAISARLRSIGTRPD